jgi:hypothetical protein
MQKTLSCRGDVAQQFLSMEIFVAGILMCAAHTAGCCSYRMKKRIFEMQFAAEGLRSPRHDVIMLSVGVCFSPCVRAPGSRSDSGRVCARLSGDVGGEVEGWNEGERKGGDWRME